MKVIGIRSAGRAPVYNMTVDEHHNFLIGGNIILHNCDALRYFAISRSMSPQRAIVHDDDEDERTNYDDYMTGGAVSAGYLNY